MNILTIQNLIFDEIISAEEIESIEQRVADAINADYQNKDLLCVGVLNGGALYTAGLFKRLTVHAELTFVRLKSYDGENTSGKVTEQIPLQVSPQGRHILLIEDIVDTGTTMHYYKQALMDAGAASVKVTSLVCKPEKLLFEDARPDYCGKEVPNLFLVGYGLDYDEYYRNTRSIFAKRG